MMSQFNMFKDKLFETGDSSEVQTHRVQIIRYYDIKRFLFCFLSALMFIKK